MPRWGTIRLWMRDFYQKKLRQTYRISRKTLDFASLVLSTALAVLFSWGGQTCRYWIGVRPQLIWSLLSGIIASIISRRFSPKPFYHFAADVSVSVCKNYRRKIKFAPSKRNKHAPKSTALLSRTFFRRADARLDDAPLPLFSSSI